ncbi:hypothetical protein Rsub_03262 [Raphidocelis subcapitata]|uniref:CHRD domain-containing protein n=1 Tax=Raphidocelis subcapitata TaxID=307507 RepID=A0A2V0NS25_9CHLO|nr:hypothetical protein Rsub_03262 [Raphidocelis subcapitata]|eukprot:GBF90129.1 hypothetical protein Rsub_03262 [Raphidocelis subcapitata]
MTSSRGVAGVAAILLAAALIQSASAATCAVKVAGKEASPGKGKFKGSLCWDGLVTPQTVISVNWIISTVTNYRYTVFGNFSTLSTTSPKAAEIVPPVGYLKRYDATATADEFLPGATILDKLALAKLFCSGDAGLGIVALDSSKAPKVIASIQVAVPKSAAEACKSLP